MPGGGREPFATQMSAAMQSYAAVASPRPDKQAVHLASLSRRYLPELRASPTAANEFYRVTFRKKLYPSLETLQADLDAWLTEYNEARHRGARATLSDRVPAFTHSASR